ncbi:uncharacterized protein radil2b isoform X2 [Engraulis encrasicolus]|uniref:uncharacterized protein radil2b isoform X2 n=1 Tax=Engraulis encrasicolus TaxID=184585 RepID=UPI002FD47355
MSSEVRIVEASKTSVISPVSLRKLSFGKVGRKQSNGSVQGATTASPTNSSRSLESGDSGQRQRQPSKSRVRRHHHRLSAVFSRSFSTLGRGSSGGGGYYYGMASDGGGGGGAGGGEDGGGHLVADDPAELSNQVTAPGILKIFGNEICEGANYKSVLATTQSSAKELVKEALERYSLDKADADAYVLCDVIGCITDHLWRTECLRVVGDNEKPLLLQSMWKPREGHSRRFEIQRRATVEEKTGREKDTITAGINAQARKLQKTRSRGKTLFLEMTRRRSQNEGHGSGGLGGSFGGLFRSRSEADIVVEEEPPSNTTDTESQSQGSPVKSAGSRSQSQGSPAKSSSSRSQSPAKSASSRSHSPVKSASSGSISVGGRSHSSPVKSANKGHGNRIPVKSASSGAIGSPGCEAQSASPKKGAGARRGSFWVGEGSGLRSRPGSQSGGGGGTASELHKDAQCPATEREERKAREEREEKESSDVVSSGSSSRASQYSIHPPLHFPYFLLLQGYSPSQDFIIYPITGERTVFGCGDQPPPSESGPTAVDVSLWAPDVNPQHCVIERLQPADLSPLPIRAGEARGSTGIRSNAPNPITNTNSSTTTNGNATSTSNGNATSTTNSNLSTSTSGSPPTTTTTRSSSTHTNHTTTTTTNCNSNHHCSSTNGDAPSTYTNGDATSTSLSPITIDCSSSSSSSSSSITTGTATIIATRSATTRTLLKPFPGALVKRNGVCVTRETFLRNGDLVGLGDYYLLMFKDPAATASEGVAPYAKLMPALHACGEGGGGGGGVAMTTASAPLSPMATEPLCNTCMSSSSSATVVPTSPCKSNDVAASNLSPLRGGDGEELRLVYELGQEELVVREIFSSAGKVAAGRGGGGGGDGGDQPKLTAALLLCLCLQRSAAHFSSASLRKLLLGIASDVQTMVWQCAKDLAADQPEINQDLQEPQLLTICKLIPGLQPMVLWMANSIELLHFIQHELPLLLHGLTTNGELEEHGGEEEEEDEEHMALLEMRMSSVRPASEEAMTVLEEVIMFTFQQCVYYITKVLYPLLPSVLDSHPFSESGQVVVPEEISNVLEVLQRALQLLRDFQVHWDIGSQLIAYLFFFINAFLFNLLMERGSGGSFYQWSRGVQIRANLDLLMDWAHGVELGDLAQACLNKLSTAVNLLATPKEHLLQDSWASLRVEFSQLNAAQLHHMLREYSPGRGGPPAWSPPSTDAPAAFTTGDILESLDNHPPLVLPCTGFLLELGRPITDAKLSTQLHRLQQFINTLPHTGDGADVNPETTKDTVAAVPLEAKVTKMESLPRAQLEVGQAEKVLPHHHGDSNSSPITVAMTTTMAATMTTTTTTKATTNSNSAIIRTRTDLAAYASLLNQRLSSLERQSAEGANIGRTSSSGSSSSGGSASSGGSGGSGGSGSSGSESLAFYPARSHYGPHGPPSVPSSPKLRQLVLAEVEAEIEPHLRQMVLAEIEAEIPSSPELRQKVLAQVEADLPSSPRLRQMVLAEVEADYEPPTSPRLRQKVLAEMEAEFDPPPSPPLRQKVLTKVEADFEPPTSPQLRQMVLAKVQDEFEPQFSPRLRKLVLGDVEADGLLDESDTETEAEDPRQGEENGARCQKADRSLNHNHHLGTHTRDTNEVLEEEEEEEQEEGEELEEEGDGDVGDEDDGDEEEEEEEEEREVFAVELQRGLCGLGLALVNGRETPLDLEGIYIRSILPGSPAEMSQRLSPGDRIMAVNGVSLVGMDYHGGRELIQKCGEKPRFLVSRSMWGARGRRGRRGIPNESTS